MQLTDVSLEEIDVMSAFLQNQIPLAIAGVGGEILMHRLDINYDFVDVTSFSGPKTAMPLGTRRVTISGPISWR